MGWGQGGVWVWVGGTTGHRTEYGELTGTRGAVLNTTVYTGAIPALRAAIKSNLTPGTLVRTG